MLILAFIILLILGIIFIRRKENHTEFPKTIWILWLQGWDSAPWLQQRVKESWEKHNPNWEVRCIDEQNCPVNIDGDTHQAKSDVIRLRILDELGGVWADSTMLCMEPLDNWYEEAITPAGMWMYHGGSGCKAPASWFILSKPNNYILSEWRKSNDEYWKSPLVDYGYFWMDALFNKLCESDPKFKSEWDKVPYECCEDFGSSHMFAGKVLNSNKDLQESLKSNPPHAIKLDKGCSDDPSLDNNCTFAVNL
jgi:hypothetical protein